MRRRIESAYGAGALHLLAVVASLAFAGFVLLEVLDQSQPTSFLLFFGAAIVLHDLIAFPLYSLLDLIARRGIGADRGGRLHVAALNHLRVPAALSALALVVWFPLILGRSDRYESTTGLDVDVFFGRWLLITAVLFGLSALVFAIRLARVRGRASPETGAAPAPTSPAPRPPSTP